MNAYELDRFLSGHNELEEFISRNDFFSSQDKKYDIKMLDNLDWLWDLPDVRLKEIVTETDSMSNQVYSCKDNFIISKHIRFIETPFHKHNFIEMIYVYEGECKQLIETVDHQVILKKNEICFLNPNVKHTIERAGEHDIILNCIIPVEFCDQAFLNLISINVQLSEFFSFSFLGRQDYYSYIIFNTSDNADIRNIMLNILLEYYNKKISYKTAIKGHLIVLFIELMRAYDNCQSVTSLTIVDHKVSNILRYIQSNLESVTLQKVADQFHFNDNYLSRLLKDKMKLSFSEILLYLKLERACFLLKNTEISIHQISEQLGYQNSNYFYKIFKSKYNMTPSTYRKQNNLSMKGMER